MIGINANPSRLAEDVYKYFFNHKYHNRKTQHTKQDEGAKSARFGFFSEIPHNKKHKDNQPAATNVHSPGFKLFEIHGRLSLIKNVKRMNGAAL